MVARKRRLNEDVCQWQAGPGGVFRPCGDTVLELDAGAYQIERDMNGVNLRKHPIMSDEIVDLPDSPVARVLSRIGKFWMARDKYVEHGLVYKTGVLVYGPQGGGKTVMINMLARELTALGGLVLYGSCPDWILQAIGELRKIEPDRRVIVVLEDLEEIIDDYGEGKILSLLDGDNQTDGVVWVATTNYPEKLPARVMNRPSRFDERILVGMPSYASRLKYLERSMGVYGMGWLAQTWATDTDGFSIAHLRELVVAVRCLDQDYADVLARLRSMMEAPDAVDGYEKQGAAPQSGILAGLRR